MYRYRVEYLKEEQTRNLLVSEHEELVKACLLYTSRCV